MTAANVHELAGIVRRSLDYRWKQDRAEAALNGLLTEIARLRVEQDRLREEIRLLQTSRIPMRDA